jgi:serine/threonine protein kinase
LFLDYLFVLEVAFEDNAAVKALGARWNPQIKKWTSPNAGIRNGFGKFVRYWQRDLQQIVYGNYIAIYEIKRSGQSTVFAGQSLLKNEDVAIKVFDREETNSNIAFKREVTALAKVCKGIKNVAQILQYGSRDDQFKNYSEFFIVLKRYELTMLRLMSLMSEDEEKVTWDEEICNAYLRLLKGLSQVHLRGAIHRDLKPSNIFVEIDERKDLCHFIIGDFGISKIDELLSTSSEQTLVEIKSGGYRPEVTSLEKKHQATWDVYGFVATLISFMTMTGIEDRKALLSQFKKLKALGMPEEIEKLFRRCVDRDPRKRPANTTVLLEEIQDCITSGKRKKKKR